MQSQVRRVAPIIGALLLLALVSCDTRPPVLRLEETPGPPGGAVFTIATTLQGEDPIVVAPTEFSLYLHDGKAWTSVDSQILPSFRLIPFHDLRPEKNQFAFSPGTQFTAFGERLWMLGNDGALGRTVLWTSTDVGRTWNPTALPALVNDAKDAESTAPYRLVADGSRALYLIHSTSIWRLSETEDTTWETLDLTGVAFTDAVAQLPAVIRNYLPASKSRSFEVLTVLRDQLMVYRRTAADEPWVLTSTLQFVDRQLVSVPNSETVFLISANGVYRSDDQVEQWFRASPPESDTDVSCALVVPATDSDTGHALLVGTSDGTIRRASTTASDWADVHVSNGRFPITGLTVDPAGRIWASTLGDGVVYSDDAGVSWRHTKTGLRASGPLDIDLDSDGTLFVATEAGLFQKSGDADSDKWTLKNRRPTATVAYDPLRKILISGTFDGEVIVIDGDEVRLDPFPMGSPNTPEIRPRRLDRALIPSTTVVEAVIGPDRNIVLGRRTGAAEWTPDASWRARDFPSSLTSALSSSCVTDLVVGKESTVFIAEESNVKGGATQIWRSDDNGETWAAVHSFTASLDATPTILEKRSLEWPNHLFVAHDSKLWHAPSGTNWSERDGPWSAGTILGMDVRNERAVVIASFGRKYALYVLDSLEADSDIADYELLLPDRARGETILEVAFHQRRLWVITQRAIYTGTLPLGSGRYEGFGATMAALVLLLGVVIGFAILKTWGR